MNKITPLRLSDAARSELERSSNVAGRERGSMKEVAEDRILQRDRFSPAIERMIADYIKQHECGRDRAIESLLVESLVIKAAGRPSSELRRLLNKHLSRERADDLLSGLGRIVKQRNP